MFQFGLPATGLGLQLCRYQGFGFTVVPVLVSVLIARFCFFVPQQFMGYGWVAAGLRLDYGWVTQAIPLRQGNPTLWFRG